MGRPDRIVAIFCGASLGSCGGHALNVGSNDDRGATDADLTDSDLVSASCKASAADGAAGQVWCGQLENHQFADGSDALTLTLEFASGGRVTGSLLLGSGALLAPPTDPNAGYPPGASFGSFRAPLVEGFPYTILGGTLSGSHLTFHAALFEVWTKWCAIQTSYLVGQGSYSASPGATPSGHSCLPPYSEQFPTGCFQGIPPPSPDASPMTSPQLTPIDCGKLELCEFSSPCRCVATGCTVNPWSPSITMDLAMAGGKADGSMSGEFGTYNVHFVQAR
jgi:hypothetical protein